MTHLRSALPALGTQWLRKSPRWLPILVVAAACLLAFALRCLHLLDADHYFMVSADSHYFHRMAELLVLGDSYYYPTHHQVFPLGIFMGTAYPLAFFARTIALFTPVSSLDALAFVARFLPPLLAVATVLLLYICVSRLYGRRIGALAAFVWAIVPAMMPMQAAGYLDRDCLSLLLVTTGAFLFYFLSAQRAKTGNQRFGWVIAALAALSVEVLLYVEWGFLGPAILLAVIVAFVVMEVLNRIIPQAVQVVLGAQDLFSLPFLLARTAVKGLSPAVKQSYWKPASLLLAFNLILVVSRPAMVSRIYHIGADVLRDTTSGTQTVQELVGMGPSEILAYGPLLIAIVLGLYIVLKRRSRSDLLLLGWVGILFLGGLFAKRLFLYAGPALCVIAAISLSYLLDARRLRLSKSLFNDAYYDLRVIFPHLRVGLAILVVLLTLWMSTAVGLTFARQRAVSVDLDWNGALTWLRENTPEDAVVMTWWDYGYWILDVAHRVPLVDNGTHWQPWDEDIARVYCTEDDSTAVDIMTRYGATYLVFSTSEIAILPTISDYAIGEQYGDGNSIPWELSDSLYARSFQEDFPPQHGLMRVYSAPEVSEPSVVILTVADGN